MNLNYYLIVLKIPEAATFIISGGIWNFHVSVFMVTKDSQFINQKICHTLVFINMI